MKKKRMSLLLPAARVLVLAAGLLLALSCQNPMSGAWSSRTEVGGEVAAKALATAYDWESEAVDCEGFVGLFPSLVQDPGSGKSHLSYFDGVNGSLKYACRDGSGWNLTTVDTQAYAGLFTSLALDGNGYPCISYWKYPQASPTEGFLVYFDPVTGAPLELAPGSEAPVSAIGFGVLGINGAELRLARWDGASWVIDTVDTACLGGFTSLAMDRDGNPCIAYLKCVNRCDPATGRPLGAPKWELRLAIWKYNHWSIKYVDKCTAVLGPSLAMITTNDNYPCISYWKSTGRLEKLYRAFCGKGTLAESNAFKLTLARWKGIRWAYETLDSSPLGLSTSIAIDDTGHPCVAYWKIDAESMQRLRAFLFEFVENLPKTPHDVEEMAQGAGAGAGAGIIGMSLQDLPAALGGGALKITGTLNYVRCMFRDYAVQTVASECEPVFPSLGIGAYSVPNISFYDTASCSLKFAQRAWDGWKFQTVETAPGAGVLSSLSYGADRVPAIGYLDLLNGDLRYAGATPVVP